MKKLFFILSLIITLIFFGAFIYGQEIEWVKQFGTSIFDDSRGISVHSSGVYAVGITEGSFANQINSGGLDAWVKKYDFDGNEIWTRQFGSSGDDHALGVFVNSNGVYVVGVTSGIIPGQSSVGNYDAFVRKYDFDGNEIWTRQFGTDSLDNADGIHGDSSGVYVTGATYGVFLGQTSLGQRDAFIRKYNFSGDELWTRQFGTSGSDVASGISIASSGVYVSGSTSGSFPNQSYSGSNDAFVSKYDSNGNQIWVRQFGTAVEDLALGVSADSNGIYVVGRTDGTIQFQTNSGSFDAFVRKYETNGNEIWTRQFGTNNGDLAQGVFVESDSIYVTGFTGGRLSGQNNLGSSDAYIRNYNFNGNEIWTRQFGTVNEDQAFGISVLSGNIYVAGRFFTSTNLGSSDAFVAKIISIAPPPQFWSEVQNAPGGLRLRANSGLVSDTIKILPNSWAIRVTNTADVNGNNVDIDGYRWYQVEDKTDGAVGWMAAKNLSDGTVYLDYNANLQSDLENKAAIQLTTSDQRKPVILNAVDTYYTSSNAVDSLYTGGGGKDGLNNFQRFIQGSTFPKELVLSIAAQESGPSFNNEVCSSVKDGGIGIMQITSSGLKGLGSGLDNIQRKNDCDAKSGWVGDFSKYYSNALQGIYANIKDGFRVLQDKYRQKCPKESIIIDGYVFACQDIEKILTTWGYNGFIKDVNGNYIWHYLRDIANKLETLNDYFSGIIYNNSDNLIEKLKIADANKQIIKAYSPVELRVIDSQGKVTGVVDGQTKEEINNSLYESDQEVIAIFFPENSYKYRLVGKDNDNYGLLINNEQNGVSAEFNARNIPIRINEIHQYEIDWSRMGSCEQGAVILKIDYEGDGIFDKIVRSDCDLYEIESPQITISPIENEYLLNSTLQINFSATDNISGVASIIATLNGAEITNGQIVILDKPGNNLLKIVAIDNEGNDAILEKTFNVIYNFGGFLPPIKIDGSGVYNLGRTLPVKFRLTDVTGNIVSTALAHFYVAKISDGIIGNDEIPLSTSSADTGNQFRYDPANNQYVYNLSTDTLSAGSWQLKAVLDSGQTFTVIISIK